MKNDITTAHSLERAKERMGFSEKRATRMIELAINRGKRAEEFSSREREFLERHTGGGRFAVAYNNFCYIISEFGACVTMWQLPSWFCKKKCFDGKEKIRNMKAYSRNYNLI